MHHITMLSILLIAGASPVTALIAVHLMDKKGVLRFEWQVAIFTCVWAILMIVMPVVFWQVNSLRNGAQGADLLIWWLAAAWLNIYLARQLRARLLLW